MKDERNVRHRRTAGGRWRPAAIILAAVLMAVSVPLFGNTAYADPVDVENRDCSMTIKCSASSEEDKQMLDEADIVVDIYRVGKAIPDDMYDTYHWESLDPVGDFVLPEDTDRAGWRQVTNELTNLVLGAPSSESGLTQWNPNASDSGSLVSSFKDFNEVKDEDKLDSSWKTTVKLGTPVTGLKSGIYLLIPHGNNIADYVSANKISLEDESGEGSTAVAADPVSNPASTASTIMLARSSRRTYQFAPELIALPTKAPNENGEINTANYPYEWLYDLTEDAETAAGKRDLSIVLKPAQLGVGGQLTIVKDLIDYEQRIKEGKTVTDDATFVFEVTAYENEEAYKRFKEGGVQPTLLYHDYVSITFREPREKSAIVEDIPVGAFVVVEEVYSGRSYSATIDPAVHTTTIVANDTAVVHFDNEYDDRPGGGGSLTNVFTYNGSGWNNPTRWSDNSTEATIVTGDLVENGKSKGKE